MNEQGTAGATGVTVTVGEGGSGDMWSNEVTEAIVYLLGDKWIPSNPMWGMADEREKEQIFIVHKWLEKQRRPLAQDSQQEESRAT